MHQYVGRINFTLVTDLEVPTIKYDGHFGIFVKEKFRGHRYASKALKILIPWVRDQLGLNPIYVCCDEINIASFKSIQYAGGNFLGILDVPRDIDLYLEEKLEKVASFKFS